uniref:Uncharacterized protein n=1 Tax=Arundo donax TaxID=35708 RepID=A0A0A9CW42_ARUDO
MDKLPEMTGTSRTQRRKPKILSRILDEEASTMLLPGNTYLLTSNSTSLSILTLSNTSLCLFCKANVRKSIKHFRCSRQPSLIQLLISSNKQVYNNGSSFRSTSSHNLWINPVMTS